MTRLLILLFAFLLVPVLAHADLLRWTDTDGVVHFVDDLHKVPQEYRKGIELIETKPYKDTPERAVEDNGAKKRAPDPLKKANLDLYGDHPLDWWVRAIKNLKESIADLEDSYNKKSEYVTVFEGGRKFGQIYEKKDVRRYEEYKKQLPNDESKLEKLKKSLKDLLLSARRSGVPKNVRGD